MPNDNFADDDSFKEKIEEASAEIARGELGKAVPWLAGAAALALTGQPVAAGLAKGGTEAIGRLLANTADQRFKRAAFLYEAEKTEEAGRQKAIAEIRSSLRGDFEAIVAGDIARFNDVKSALALFSQESEQQWLQIVKLFHRDLAPIGELQMKILQAQDEQKALLAAALSPRTNHAREFTLSVNVLRGPAQHEAPRNAYLYSVTRSPGVLSAVGRPGYMAALAEGAPLSWWLCRFNEFEWDFPELDVVVVNNSPATVSLVAVAVEVASSRTDPRPNLKLGYPLEVLPQGPNAHGFKLVNDGWGPAHDVVARFHLSPMNVNDDALPFDGPFPHSLDLGTCEKEIGVDLSATLQAIGLDTEAIRAAFDRHKGWDVDRVTSLLGAFAKFGQVTPMFYSGGLVASGELAFSGKDSRGASHTFKQRFFARVPLGPGQHTQQQQAQMPPGGRYSIPLQVDQNGYVVEVPIAHVIKAGDADRFLLRLMVPCSSMHDLVVKVLEAGGTEMRSISLEIEAYLPRSALGTAGRRARAD